MDSQQDVECDQCQTVPETYVKLECDHKFCLICLAYNYLQIQQEKQNLEELERVAVCFKCNHLTKLDQDTVEALHMVIKEIIVPLIEQNQINSKSNNDSEVVEVIDDLRDLGVQNDGSQHQSNQKNSMANERLQLYLERLEKSFKSKFEAIKDIQDQKHQFQSKCKQTKDEINSQYQQFILSLEQKKNQTFNDINSLEMIQLLEIQKQEKDLEQQIQQMAQFQEEINSLMYQNLNKSQEDISKLLIDIEKSLNTPSSSLQIKSSILATQRQLLKLSTNAQSQLSATVPNLLQDFPQSIRQKDLFMKNQNSDEKPLDSKLNVHFERQDRPNKFSPIKSEKLNELWPKNDKSHLSLEKNTIRESKDLNEFKDYREKEKDKKNQKVLTQESLNANPKQKFIYEDSDDKSRNNNNSKKLFDSQISQKNNLVSKWKDQLFDVFDKKTMKQSESPKVPEKHNYATRDVPYHREPSTHYPRENKNSQEKLSTKQQLINRACTIHDVLNMQYQNFMTQKENLIRR
ncbi:unnamed protein product [Paramecium pentaurelia]|uniref:RING-type domain-containing protein n=1 Tax=Paramecium pentaurelia TaxID=43138 RepID=A0A8S1UVV1_9CILI|nr:unnamed protein product [Paramecium pentaurelia]